MVKHLPTKWETWVRSLGWEDPLEKEMATHSSTLTWKIPWTEERGRLQSMGSQSRTRLSDFAFTLLAFRHTHPRKSSWGDAVTQFNFFLTLFQVYQILFTFGKNAFSFSTGVFSFLPLTTVCCSSESIKIYKIKKAVGYMITFHQLCG